MDDPFELYAASDILARIRPPQMGIFLGPYPGDGVLAPDPVDDPLTLSEHPSRREDDDIIFCPQVFAIPDFLERDVRIGNLQLVQGQTEPALVLSVQPGVQEGQARDIEVMSLDAGKNGQTIDREPEVLCGCAKSALEVGRVSIPGDDEASGDELDAALAETVFRCQHLYVFEPVAESHELGLGCVVDGEGDGLVLSHDLALDHDIFSKEGHGRFENFRVRDPDRLDVVERSQRPARVIVGAGIFGVVVLGVEEHVGAAAVGLVHPDDVAPGRILVLPDRDLGIRDVDLDAVLSQQVDEPGGGEGTLGPAGDQVGRRAFRPRLGHGPFALQVEVLQKPGPVIRDVLEGEEKGTLLEVDVIAE